MLWPYPHPEDWKNEGERRWTAEREAAAYRRLAAGGPHVERPAPLRRMLQYIEHMFSYVEKRAVPSSHPTPQVEPVSDAELARLLTLLAPDGKVLYRERVPRKVPDRDLESRTLRR